MPAKTYDFSGWATRNDLKCSDGRTIRRDAFKECDGKVVPLVWNHDHNNPANVLGHALLENRPEGVYTYGSFNDTESGQAAKELVKHSDVVALSIYANRLKQNGGDVLHGAIREVSLVLAGANPAAFIDNVFAHSDDGYDEDGIVYSPGEAIELYHGEDISEDQKEEEVTNEAAKDPEMSHADEKTSDEGDNKMAENEKTVKDVVDSMNEEQKKVLYFLVGEAAKGGSKDDDEAEHSDIEGDYDMKRNVFDQNGNGYEQDNVLSHSDMETILSNAKRMGSLKAAFEDYTDGGELSHSTDVEDSKVNGQYTTTYGIQGVDWLFPEARNLNMPPEFIKRENDWVPKVMNAAHHTPFSRFKSMYANITEDEARAKGYVKGHQKVEEVIFLLRRSTTPQTVYKKQKMDRDDIIDITDFDVVAWLKGEMRMMLNEEIARAALIGDGRPNSSDDKISEDHIRPIVNDDDLFTIKKAVSVPANATDDDISKEIIKSAIKARIGYKGSGNPVLFTTEEWLTNMLLLEDGIGHPMYKTEAELATKLRVREIVTVPVMEGAKFNFGTGASAITNKPLIGIIVNMADYTIGADKGGAVSMFEDFDIDYNQEKYLIETRCSGALTKPYSAITLYLDKASA